MGKKLYTKITEVLHAETNTITEQDCIDFIYQLVIDRTFKGYLTEKETIYGQLQDILDVQIEPAPDEWDRLYNVDFFIKINNNYIGLQIKHISATSQVTQIFKERRLQELTHKEFTAEFGGEVFYIFSEKENKTKRIGNTEIIDSIKNEIERLRNLK